MLLRIQIIPTNANDLYLYEYDLLKELEIAYDKEWTSFRIVKKDIIVKVRDIKYQVDDFCFIIDDTTHNLNGPAGIGVYNVGEVLPFNCTLQLYVSKA